MSKYRIRIDGKVYEMEIEKIEEEKPQVPTAAAPVTYQQQASSASPQVQVIPPSAEKKTEKNDHSVLSPMPGTIVKVLASVGDRVEKGQSVLVLEAMKMENEIQARKTGRITEMYVTEGQTVPGGTLLFEIGE